MAGRPSNRSSQTQAMPPAAPRQNDYFVPRDGIDREVITSDICRYLGNDALVRPGTYESPDGRVTQGYFITAYRNLTSAMIQDLKADSARWEQERRAASRSSGGAGGSREQPRGQSDYTVWKNSLRERQEYETGYGSAMEIDYPAPAAASGNPVYANQPYTAAPAANYPPAAYPAPGQYPPQPSYGYAPTPAPAQYSPQPTSGDRYPAISPVPGSYGQDPGVFVHGSNYQTSAGYATAGPARIPPAMPHASAQPSRTYPAPAGGTPVYGAEPDPYGYAPPAGNPAAAQAFPTDTLYGRGAYTTTAAKRPEASSDDIGSPAGPTPRQGYPAPSEPKYDDVQNPGIQPATTRTSPTNPTPAQVPNSAAPPARRDPEPREQRERDHRDHRSRPGDDKHADRSDRNRHRHR